MTRSGRSPGGGHGNPLQYSCRENPVKKGARLAMVHGVAESDTAEVPKHACTLLLRLSRFSRVRLCVTPQMAAH